MNRLKECNEWMAYCGNGYNWLTLYLCVVWMAGCVEQDIPGTAKEDCQEKLRIKHVKSG